MGKEEGLQACKGCGFAGPLGLCGFLWRGSGVMGQLALLVAATPMPGTSLERWSPNCLMTPPDSSLGRKRARPSKAWRTLWRGSPQAWWPPPRRWNKGNLVWEGRWQPRVLFSWGCWAQREGASGALCRPGGSGRKEMAAAA